MGDIKIDPIKLKGSNNIETIKKLEAIKNGEKIPQETEQISPKVPNLKINKADFHYMMSKRPLVKYKPIRNSFTKRGDKAILAKGLGIEPSEVDEYIDEIIKNNFYQKELDERVEHILDGRLEDISEDDLAMVREYVYRHGSKEDVLKFLENELSDAKYTLKNLYKTLDENVGGLYFYFERPCHLLDNVTAKKMYGIITNGLDKAQEKGYITQNANAEAVSWALKKIYEIQTNSKFVKAAKFLYYE